MNVQIIEKDGNPEWAVIPFKTYQQLIEDAEMLQDIQDYDAVKQAIAEGEELIPSEVVYALVDGENPIRVWREYRGLTQAHLAKVAEISVSYLSQLCRILGYAPTHSLHSTSACSNTVCVAFSCLSGG